MTSPFGNNLPLQLHPRHHTPHKSHSNPTPHGASSPTRSNACTTHNGRLSKHQPATTPPGHQYAPSIPSPTLHTTGSSCMAACMAVALGNIQLNQTLTSYTSSTQTPSHGHVSNGHVLPTFMLSFLDTAIQQSTTTANSSSMAVPPTPPCQHQSLNST